MTSFVLTKQHLRKKFCLKKKKKNTVDACQLLEEAYVEYAPLKTTCKDWFKRFIIEASIFMLMITSILESQKIHVVLLCERVFAIKPN